MSWPFLAVFFSGWLFVDASYRGPRWQRWVFKPVTLLLLLLLAWQAPVLSAAGYLIVLGLLATLIGDALLLLPRERVLYAIGAPFPLPPAVYPELRQPDDVQSVLAAAAGAAGDRRVAAGHPLDPAGRDALADRHLRGDDAADGLVGGRTIFPAQHRFRLRC